MSYKACNMPSGQSFLNRFFPSASLLGMCLALLLCGFPVPALAQTELPSATPVQPPQERVPGIISGRVVDSAGTVVAGATVKLTREDQSPAKESTTDEDGRFSFAQAVPGPFKLSIASPGFAPQETTGILHSAENLAVPQLTLAVATNVTEVRVELSPIEIAQEQMKEEEKQRVFGVIPNFYVTYIPDAAPLSTKQKFNLAWKTTIDPVSLVLVGTIAGVQQANNTFPGYGQGAAGYGRRYGAAYGDFVIGTFIGGAILPSLLKQDPRYFYKGTGSIKSRALYAISTSVICKGDNGKWQPDYSDIGGGLIAGGISNLYYPAGDRTGVALTFENALIGIGASAASHLIQEFLLHKLTSNIPQSPNNSLAVP
ncbi:MAG TPA: carboxypeptidase-like regulatory domain-containing protein [Candidatus Acidoferrum sp.]